MFRLSKVFSLYNLRSHTICIRTIKALPRTQDGKLIQDKKYKMVQYQHTLLLSQGYDIPEKLSEEMMEELILTKSDNVRIELMKRYKEMKEPKEKIKKNPEDLKRVVNKDCTLFNRVYKQYIMQCYRLNHISSFIHKRNPLIIDFEFLNK